MISLFVWADLSKFILAVNVEIELDADKTTADVGEPISFNWTTYGPFHAGFVNFGDGNITSLSSLDANSSITHSYAIEGQFNVTIYGRNNGTSSEDTDSLFITITNNPPQFNISLPTSVNENEAVNISVVDLVESGHDLQPGVLSYIYDFADGTQETSNQSSIVHKWKNAGEYSVWVTVVDDQGALDQKYQELEVNNTAPDAFFTFGPESGSNNSQSSYYGTYDFRGDVIGEEPSNWSIYDADDVAIETATLRPNGDVEAGWGYSTPHYSRLDETTHDNTTIICVKRYPPDVSYPGLWVNYPVDIFDMDSVDLNGGTVTKIILHSYGKLIKEQTGAPSQPKSNINLGGWKEEQTWNFLINEYAWRTLTWDGLNASQSDLDNFLVKLKGNMYQVRTGNEIDTIYAEIYYKHNFEIAVVEVPGDYKEVVRLYDHDSTEKVMMENTFSSQNGGTIEFYIKTNDSSSQNWILSLYDSTTIGLKVYMDGDQWKFVNGTTHTMSELGTPLDDQWYRVQLDFCTSGTYLDLNANQFQITVDNTSSNIYYFEDITQVNKIKFESIDSVKGITWIDAIGYSWDPDYNVGDNKYPVISYPEKTNVEFLANCTDTGNDIPSLRYMWHFGDGSEPGWGRFVKHNYLSSGIYKVNLTCKDDNGVVDSYDRLVVIHNCYPEVLNINTSQEVVTINEGETITFNATTTDDDGDISRLSYYWDYEEFSFNPYNTSEYEQGGWVGSHLYQDDYNGSSYLLVKDPDNAFGYQSIAVNVVNVDPSLSIWDAKILANVSFEVFRKSTNYDANFSFELWGNDIMKLAETISFGGSSSLLEYTNTSSMAMTLANMWKVKINSSSTLPTNSWFKCYIKLQFLDGQVLVISSPKLYGGNYGEWDVDLNPYFFNNGDNTFMYPLTLNAQIWDPSIDDISLTTQYNISLLLKINCSDSLPVEDSFELEHALGNVSYTISIYEESGIQYANITCSQWILSKTFVDNEFPVSIDFNFTVYPILDLFELLQNQMGLTNITITECVNAYNYISSYLVDDDGGEGNHTVIFHTESYNDFDNLSPYISTLIPDQALQGNEITFFIEISDYDQIIESIDYNIASYTDAFVPSMPDNFTLINGTCDWEGELVFQNDISATFTPDDDEIYPATYSFTENDVNSDPSGWSVGEYTGTVNVISSLGDHNKVLELHDTGSSYPRARNQYSEQVSGTAEFWMRTSDDTKASIVYMGHMTDGAGLCFKIDNNYFMYRDSSWHNIKSSAHNTWYHIRVDFECGNGGYQGLAADRYRIYIDGVQYGDYAFINSNNRDDFDYFYVRTFEPDTGYYSYFDAIGYSWSSNYTLGDNLCSESVLNFTSSLKIDELDNGEVLKYFKLFYGYNTDSSSLVNLSLYNFKYDNWTIIDSTKVDSQGYQNRFSIINHEFLNDTREILVKVESDELNGDFYLDQLKLEYYTYETSDIERTTYYTVPSQIPVLNGTLLEAKDLILPDNNYSTYNSLANLLNLESQFQLEDMLSGDSLEYLCLNYSLKTNISQLVNISIYNFTSDNWDIIESSIHTSFFNGSYNITSEDYYDTDFELFIRINGENESSEFQLYLDQFSCEYQFIPYSFRSNTSSVIDAVEGDYSTFQSSKYSDHYLGTYSFTEDEDGSDPIGWSIYEGEFYVQTEINVEGEIDGHQKVLAVKDPDAWTNEYCSATNTFESGQSNGSAEWWFRSAGTEAWQNTDVRFGWDDIETDDSEIMFRVYFTSNKMYVTHSGGNTEVFTFSANTWYHLQFTWDATDGGYDGNGENNCSFYVDSVKKGEFTFWNSHDSVEKISIRSRGHTTSNKKVYFDAFGYSWSSNYTLGTNRYATCHLNETFNLSLENLDDQRINLFEACKLDFSLKTNTTQNVTLSLYNFKEDSWDEFTSLITDNSTFYSGSYVFTDVDYIGTDYQIKVLIYGLNITVESFELYLQTLQAEYNWSKAHADFGIAFDHLGLQLYDELCSWNSTAFYGTYVFENEGTFLLTLSAYDGYTTTHISQLIEITGSAPYTPIGNFGNVSLEDKTVHFTTNLGISEENSTIEEYKYFWYFGDGSYSNEQEPSHAYAESGVYNISLTVMDQFGNIYTDIKNITIAELAPRITGPFSYYGVEGQALDLDIDVFDSVMDESDITYEWYNGTSIVSTNKKPSITLQDGIYKYTLNATDNVGQTATAEISIVIEDVPPIVLVSNYMYSGGIVSGIEGFYAGAADDPGEFVLNAYAYDSPDNDNLDYYWKIFRGESSFSITDFSSGIESSIKFRVKETALYRGEVRVESGDMSTTATFVINSMIDSNGNGFSNEFEAQLLEVNESITAYSDIDNDGYSDLYEISISNTSSNNPDSDYDGLNDCLDPETGIGESSVNTNPLDWDHDDDGLADGVEVFGWKITSELLGEIVVNSDPCSNNSDSDDLMDYEEYNAGTDPRNPDSDNDGLQDHIDPYPMKRDGDSDNLLDGLEVELGTNPNNTDSDNDGLNDAEEVLGWGFCTDPLSADGDHDFIADNAEMQNYKVSIDNRYDLDDPVAISFELNCEEAAAAQIAFLITFGEAVNEPENNKTYGIQNIPELNVSIYKVDSNLLLFNMTTNSSRYFSQVIDIREIVENKSLDYRGEYMIKVNDTSAGCILEQFEIVVVGYLDPNNPDYDGDLILDGVEMGLLVEGIDEINFTDYYQYDNLTVDFDVETFDEFYLDIPHIGKVDDADLSLEIVSDEIPIIGGNISIQLIKEEMNCSIENGILLNYTTEFSNNSVFSYENSFDLQDYLNNETIVEFYGSYKLKIDIYQNNTIFDNFTLSQFFLQTDTYIEALSGDSEAWYTNPMLADSDNDGWDDYYEIFAKNTNPLVDDTDADGIIDSLDINPVKDAVLMISPISASVPGGYTLQIVSSYSTVGEDDSYYFCSTKQKADVSEDSLYTAFFDGTNSSSTDLHYYTNIDDVRRVLSFNIQLWSVDRTWGLIKKWDKKLLSGEDTFAVQKVGDSEVLEIVSYDAEENVKYRARVKVEIIGVEKSNTIAIYEKNGTVFNDHYQSLDRMNVIQLYVNDTPLANSPFVQGPNSIVIPTSLFTETILNGYIQNERLNETFFYSGNEELFKFISVEREGYTEQACSEIDFIMIRFEISATDAEKLLDLILTCVVNESLDENNNTITTNATLYSCYSTKLNNTSAVNMNLPSSVLGLISWFCNFSDSPQGSQPEDFESWFWKPLEVIGGFVGGIILSVIMLPVIIFALITRFIIDVIILALLPIYAFILWVILRVVLLVLFYILLALELVVTIATTLIMGAVLLLMGSFMSCTPKFGLNILILYGKDCKASNLELNTEGSELKFETWIIWVYWSFFDLYIPWISTKTVTNDITMKESKYSIITDEIVESSEEIGYNPSLNETAPQLSNHKSIKLEENNYEFSVAYWDSNYGEPDINYGVRLHLISPNGTSLEHYEMGNVDTPDFSNPFGAVFNYTVDLDDFEEGQWHYYFTTKDNTTGEEVANPVEGYFIGPCTVSNSSDTAFIYDSLIINSNRTYYSPEGWINDEFNFYIKWWDITNSSAPLNVSLCLIPANRTNGTGITKTTGIQKFSMQPVDSSPNYTKPVEFHTVINFADLGYNQFEIGDFFHYYEAVTNGSVLISNIDSNDNHYLNGPFVKNLDNAYVSLTSYSSTNSDGIITRDDNIRYYLTFSDYDGLGPSEVPKIELSQGDSVITYNMTSLYNSTNGTERKYYVEVKGEDLEVGTTYNVNCSVIYDGVIINSDPVGNFNELIKVFHPVGSILFTMNTVLAFIGTTSLTGLIGVSCLMATLQNSYWKLIASLVYFGVVLTMLLGTFLPLLLSQNWAALLGFSIACFSILTCLSLGSIFKATHSLGGISGSLMKFTNIQMNFINGFFITMLFSFGIMTLFMNDVPMFSFLGDLWIFIGQIFTLIPWLLGILTLSLTVNTLLEFANPDKDEDYNVNAGFSLGGMEKAFSKTYSAGAYKSMRALYIGFTSIIGIFTILGFIAFGFSLKNSS